MLPTDEDLIFSLQPPTGNDHRNSYSVHVWHAINNSSQIIMFYAYDKFACERFAREYVIRFMSPYYQIVSIKKEVL